MQDPHVEALYYRLEPYNNYYFQDPAPITGSTDDFDFTLAQENLKITMKAHFSDSRVAREVVERYLDSWALCAEITLGQPWLRFRYEHDEVIDRNPPSGGGVTLSASASLVGIASMAASLSVGKTAYPSPPSHFVASWDAQAFWQRYAKTLEDPTSLAPMAYACLEWLEYRTFQRYGLAKERKQYRAWVAQDYRIEPDVLKTMGDLTSEVGDIHTGRKFSTKHQMRKMTVKEEAFVRAVVKAMIRRIGEFEADPSSAAKLRLITMDDLPSPT